RPLIDFEVAAEHRHGVLRLDESIRRIDALTGQRRGAQREEQHGCGNPDLSHHGSNTLTEAAESAPTGAGRQVYPGHHKGGKPEAYHPCWPEALSSVGLPQILPGHLGRLWEPQQTEN